MTETNVKISYTLGLEELILLNLPYYHPEHSRDLLDLYQITHDIFHRTRKYNPKIYWNHERSRFVKVILRKRNKAGGITLQTSDNT